MEDDSQLLRAYVENHSEQAFADLVNRHLALVYHSALRQLGGDSHGAMDTAQSVFILLSQKAPSLLRHPSLAGWLYAATHFKAARARRANRRRNQIAVRAMSERISESTSEDDGWGCLRPVLDGAMLKLSPADREAILLRYLEERSLPEISARLRISESAAYKRVERAMDRLRTVLAGQGITSSGAALAVTLTAQGALRAPSGLASAITGAVFSSVTKVAIGSAFLPFMSTTKVAFGLAAVTIGLMTVDAIRETRAEHYAEAAYAKAHREAESLAARVDAASRGLHETNAKAAQAVKPAQPTGQRSDSDLFVPAAPDGKAFLKAHPEVKAAWLADQRAQTSAQYGELFRSLGLSASQIERFEDIKINSIVMASLFRFTLDFSDTALTWHQAQDQLREMLGSSGYQAYVDYDRGTIARNIGNQRAQTAAIRGLHSK